MRSTTLLQLVFVIYLIRGKLINLNSFNRIKNYLNFFITNALFLIQLKSTRNSLPFLITLLSSKYSPRLYFRIHFSSQLERMSELSIRKRTLFSP